MADLRCVLKRVESSRQPHHRVGAVEWHIAESITGGRISRGPDEHVIGRVRCEKCITERGVRLSCKTGEEIESTTRQSFHQVQPAVCMLGGRDGASFLFFYI
jgi:hypothetical protein